MGKQGFQIYLIIASALFSFLGGIFKLLLSYSLITSFLLFLFNIVMGYVVFLFWKYIEAKFLSAERVEDKPISYQIVFVFFILTGLVVFAAFYTCFFILLFGYQVSWLAVMGFSSVFYLFIATFVLYLALVKKLEVIKQKTTSLDFILNSQKIMEIEILKYQIDPHFIFNAFNTLLFLINDEPSKAYAFCQKLAKVYRYVIFSQHKNLVPLSDELDFARDYSYLQEIRHDKELIITFEQPSSTENILVLPVSIQILIENAIKHNQFSEHSPLHIVVECTDKYVSVENVMHPKKYNNTESSKIGLRNLIERSKLIIGNECIVKQEENLFKVFLPILKTQS